MPKNYFLASYVLPLTSSQLLVVIMMLGVLTLGAILAFNPLGQYNKTRDSQREHDLGQIQRALDSYNNDTHCYPTTLAFGSKWSVNGQVYMEKIPQDPNCANDTSKCYVYQTDGTSCPQWNVLYASLRAVSGLTNACPLATRNSSSSCLPTGYAANSYNYCVTSGDVDCGFISTSTIVSSGMGGGGGGGGGGSSTPTPTPGVIVCPGDQYYACTGDNRCNSIAPKTQCNGYGGGLICHCDNHCDQSCRYN